MEDIAEWKSLADKITAKRIADILTFAEQEVSLLVTKVKDTPDFRNQDETQEGKFIKYVTEHKMTDVVMSVEISRSRTLCVL